MAETVYLELGHQSRPEENDTDRRILVGTVETLRDSSTPEDAVSRLALRHFAMPQLTVGTNGVDSEQVLPSAQELCRISKGLCVCFGVYASVLCDIHWAADLDHYQYFRRRRRLSGDDQRRQLRVFSSPLDR